MSENGSNDQRSLVRTNLPFKVKFRAISQQEYGEISGERKNVPKINEKRLILEASDADEHFNGSLVNHCIVDFLFHMDEKLDLILAALSKEDAGEGSFYRAVGVDLAGSGLKMISDHPVEPGEYVQMDLYLSRFPFTFIDLLGEVVRLESISDEGKSSYRLGIKFIDLEMNERERIISCVFQRQREVIRRSRREIHDDK